MASKCFAVGALRPASFDVSGSFLRALSGACMRGGVCELGNMVNLSVMDKWKDSEGDDDKGAAYRHNVRAVK